MEAMLGKGKNLKLLKLDYLFPFRCYNLGRPTVFRI